MKKREVWVALDDNDTPYDCMKHPPIDANGNIDTINGTWTLMREVCREDNEANVKQNNIKTYRAMFERDENNAWLVTVPEVQGCHTHAADILEGLDRIYEALALFDDGEFTVIVNGAFKVGERVITTSTLHEPYYGTVLSVSTDGFVTVRWESESGGGQTSEDPIQLCAH